MANERSAPRTPWDTFRLVFAGAIGALLTLLIVSAAFYFKVANWPPALTPSQAPAPPQASTPPQVSTPQTPAQSQVATPPQPPIVTNFRVCLGEYERSCPPHDVYMYCYQDVGAWAKSHCDDARMITLGSQSGNKCGYTSVQVICTGPK
jgi:hypothetical protein